MKKNNMKRFLASLLAVLMLASVTGVSPAVFAEDAGSPPSQEEAVSPVLKKSATPIEVLIKDSFSNEQVKVALAKELLENADQVNVQSLEWTYKCSVKGTYKVVFSQETKDAREATVSVLTGKTYVEKDYVYNVTGSGKFEKEWKADATYVYPALKDNADGEYTLYLNDQSVNIKKVDKYSTKLELKDGASITYNMDAAKEKEAIVANVIDYEKSVLPAGTTAADFTVEHKSGLLWPDIPDSKLDAGENQTIRIKYNGNETYKASNRPEATINVAKATVKVSMNMFTKAYAGVEEDLSKEALGVTLTPDDKAIDIYMVFAGVNTNFDGSINLVLTDEQWAFIKKFSALEREIYDFVSRTIPSYKDKPTLEDKLTDGITIGEFKQYVNDAVNALKEVAKIPGVDNILKKYNIDIDSIAAMVSIFTELGFADDTTIAFGVPKHAGMYRAYAIAVNKNYNTGYASGTVLILMNVKNVKIVMNEKFSSKMDAATAAEVANAPASLQQNDKVVKDQSSLHYLYTGIQSNLKPYQSTTEFPTEPGRYVVTVVTLGGDYLASPVTKSFQITK